MNWILENSHKNLDGPIEESSEPEVDMNAVNSIIEMGFEELQAKIALIKHVIQHLFRMDQLKMLFNGYSQLVEMLLLFLIS